MDAEPASLQGAQVLWGPRPWSHGRGGARPYRGLGFDLARLSKGALGQRLLPSEKGGLTREEAWERIVVMGHKGWSSKEAGPAIGPYRQATEAGGFVFLSGQLALDEQGNLLSGSVAEQTRKALERAQSLLKEAGLSLGDVVKATVFLTDLKTFPEMNTVYAEFFPKDPPARSTIQVAALPKGGAVEIELLARRAS